MSRGIEPANLQEKSITILSAYNRAQWLANELKSKNYNINYLDFTDKLGGLSPEVWDSPFGIFLSKKMTYSQNIWLNEGAQVLPMPYGFTVLSEKGPLEFQGMLLKNSAKRYRVTLDQMDYLKASDQMGEESFLKFKSHFNSYEFKDVWLLNLAHSLGASQFSKNTEALAISNRPLPFTENWVLRQYSRRGAMDSLRMSSDKGVGVYKPKNLKHLQADSKKISKLQFETESQDASLNDQVYLNFLSQEELNIVSPNVHNQIFGAQVLHSDWFWTKYRVTFSTNDITDSLPKAFCYIEDRFLAWSHNNLMLIQKTQRMQEFIVWVRIPSHYRFQHTKLKDCGDKIKDSLEKKFLGALVSSIELPLECLATEFQVQVPHLPVYEKGTLKKLKKPVLQNFIHLGPETWERLDTSYLLELQMETLKKILGTEDQQGIKRRRGRDSEIYS